MHTITTSGAQARAGSPLWHGGQDACKTLLCLSSHAYKGRLLKYKLAQFLGMRRKIVQVSVCCVQQKTLL